MVICWGRVGFHAASCRGKPQTAIRGGLSLGAEHIS